MLKHRKSIGIQVDNETKNKETITDATLEQEKSEKKHLNGIFQRLKTELEELHSHIEKQQLKL